MPHPDPPPRTTTSLSYTTDETLRLGIIKLSTRRLQKKKPIAMSVMALPPRYRGSNEMYLHVTPDRRLVGMEMVVRQRASAGNRWHRTSVPCSPSHPPQPARPANSTSSTRLIENALAPRRLTTQLLGSSLFLLR